MKLSHHFLIVINAAFLAGCTRPPVPPPPPQTKFTCLAAPSGSYKAGTVIRSLPGEAGNTSSPDELVMAFTPIGAPVAANYADFTQQVAHSATVDLTGKALQKIGIVLDASAAANYTINMSAKSNTDYTADDVLRGNTFDKVEKSGFLVAGARYFFIKEALGSQDLSYVVSDGASAKGTAKLTADSSGLSANITFLDATTSIQGQKKDLIACVVLEEIQIARGVDGNKYYKSTLVDPNSATAISALAITKTQ